MRLGCGVAQVGRVRVGMGWHEVGLGDGVFLLENTWWHFHFFIFL